MNEQQIREVLSKGFENLKPSIEAMTNIMMDCYQQGFKNCFKLLTGKDLDE
jgi:hypothetical protein